jgi:hypothetical protein
MHWICLQDCLVSLAQKQHEEICKSRNGVCAGYIIDRLWNSANTKPFGRLNGD